MPDTDKETAMGITVEGSSVGMHWMHQRFVQNLIGASKSRELGGAAKEWRLHKINASLEWSNCQLCNTRIKICVVLKNKENGNFVVLGEDCYDKLVQFLSIGQVQSALPARDGHSNELRGHWRQLLKDLKDRTVVGWLREEFEAGRITGELVGAIHTILNLGFAPTTEDADKVVGFYKATRRFKLAQLARFQTRYVGRMLEMVTIAETGFRHRNLLPKEVTIDQFEKIEHILERDWEVGEKLRKIAQKKNAAEMRLKRLERAMVEMTKCRHVRLMPKTITEDQLERVEHILYRAQRIDDRSKWVERKKAMTHTLLVWELNGIVEKLTKFLQYAEAAVAAGTSRATIAVDCIATTMAKIAKIPTNSIPNNVLGPTVRAIRKIASQRMRDARWFLQGSEIVLAVKSGREQYILINREGRWQPVYMTNIKVVSKATHRTGIFRATVLDNNAGNAVLLQEELDPSQLLYYVDFSTPSKKFSGEFVGFLDGKIVLPSKAIRAQGKHLVFLTNEEGRYYRVWIVE
jgi:hypothetical protein